MCLEVKIVCFGVCVFFGMFGCLRVESGYLSVFKCVFGCVCVLSVLFMLFFRFL